MNKVEEVKRLLDELISEESESEKKRIASRIKNSIRIYSQQKRKDNELKEQTTDEIMKVLLENYDSIKQYDSINEIFEQLVEDYTMLSENTDDVKNKRINGKIFEIHRITLGNPGTSVKSMPLDYIQQIIEEKFDLEDGINRDDVINILSQVSENIAYNSEEYQKFFEDIFVPVIDIEIENGTSDLKNPKVIEILTELAKSYKRDGNYEKCKELCEKGLKLEQFKETEQYAELQIEDDKTNEAIKELNTNFEKILDISEINSVEELIEVIKRHILEGKQGTFIPTKKPNKNKPKPDLKPDIKPDLDPDLDPNIEPDSELPKEITLEEKCIALFDFLTELRKEKPNVKFANLSKGKKGTTWENYLLLPVSGAEITILENFVQNEAALYMIKNENIENIEKCTNKGEVKKEPGVENANHSNIDLEKYKERLMDKYRELMGLKPIKRDNNKYKTNTTDIKELKNVEEKTEVTPEEKTSKAPEDIKGKVVTEEIELDNLSDEELLKISTTLDEEIQELENTNTQLEEEAKRLEQERERQQKIFELKLKIQKKQQKERKKKQLQEQVKTLREEVDSLSNKDLNSGETHNDDE